MRTSTRTRNHRLKQRGTGPTNNTTDSVKIELANLKQPPGPKVVASHKEYNEMRQREEEREKNEELLFQRALTESDYKGGRQRSTGVASVKDFEKRFMTKENESENENDNKGGRQRSKAVASLTELKFIIKENEYGKENKLLNRNDWEGAESPRVNIHRSELDSILTQDRKEEDFTEKLFSESVDALRSDKSYYPNKECQVDEVLKHALHYFISNHKDQSIQWHINVPKRGKLHVIGDIHGNKDALFKYLDHIGPLSETNQLLFLGDIVDRGPHEWHCMLLVLLYKVQYGNYCTILRGNHEDYQTSRKYGMFSYEIGRAEKSTEFAREAMNTIFGYLHLCCIVNNEFFCVHGGPPVAKETTIEELSKIKLPVNLAFSNYNCCIDELMWNDPRTELPGGQAECYYPPSSYKYPNPSYDCVESIRGVGFQFKEGRLKEWMLRNKIRRILRAHECPIDEGCAVTDTFGNGLCLTVFSAPNYYPPTFKDGTFDQGSRNQGGYLTISNRGNEFELDLTHVVTGTGACSQKNSNMKIEVLE